MNSNDVFVLKLRQNNGYIWIGKGATQEEEKGAEYVASILKCKTAAIQEGEEPGVYRWGQGHEPELTFGVLAHHVIYLFYKQELCNGYRALKTRSLVARMGDGTCSICVTSPAIFK